MSLKRYYIKTKGTLTKVTEEQYRCYYRSKRRMRYFEHDIKNETPVRDKSGNITRYMKGREMSLDCILDMGVEFAAEQESVEDIAIREIMLEKLRKALDKLTDEECEFIHALFFTNGGKGMSEREYAKKSGIPRKTIAYRRDKIFEKLKNFINK